MAKNKVISIQEMIYEIRGYHVMLDEDLARIYQVETKVLNQAVKRNIDRFPPEFMFQLTNEEYENLKSQIVTSRWTPKEHENLKSQIATSRWSSVKEKILMLHIDDTNNNFTEHSVIINNILTSLNNLTDKPKETKKIGFCPD